jgi:hypothetical protein
VVGLAQVLHLHTRGRRARDMAKRSERMASGHSQPHSAARRDKCKIHNGLESVSAVLNCRDILHRCLLLLLLLLLLLHVNSPAASVKRSALGGFW